MLLYLLFFSLVISSLLSWFYISQVVKFAYNRELFDIPDERKMHHSLVPRLGGVAFLPSLFITFFVSLGISYQLGFDVITKPVLLDFCALATGLTGLYFTGILDDLVNLRFYVKLAVQFVVACFFPLSGLCINNLYGLFGLYAIGPWIGVPLTILLVIFIVNAVNLIDGIDGLASGLSIVALGFFSILFYYKGLWLYSLLATTMLGLLISFFLYNVFGSVERRRKIFMGDTGSLLLGYNLAFMSVRYASVNADLLTSSKVAIVVAFSALAIPMLDMLHVVLLRIFNGKSVFAPDKKSHIHHRLMNIGLSARQTMVFVIFLSFVFIAFNLMLLPLININLVLTIDILLWSAFNVGVYLAGGK